MLTAEALTGLDFLPRTAFFGSVILAAHGAEAARVKLVEELEDAEVTLLPDQVLLGTKDGIPSQIVVQPDAIVTSPNCYALIEVKRIRRARFGVEQLAREYVTVVQQASERTPLLLLLLGSEPPVAVNGFGRLGVRDAIELRLDEVLQRTAGRETDTRDLVNRIPEVVAWTTWRDLGRVVDEQRRAFTCHDPSVAGSVSRLAESVTQAIARHS